MSKRLTRFLVDLSKDPDRMDEFSRDPDLVLAGADLTEEEKRIAKSRDPERIRLHIDESLPRYAQLSMYRPEPPGKGKPDKGKPDKGKPDKGKPDKEKPRKPKRKPAKKPRPSADAPAPA